MKPLITFERSKFSTKSGSGVFGGKPGSSGITIINNLQVNMLFKLIMMADIGC